MKQNKHTDGQADRIRAGLQWLGSQVRETKFGSIRGILVRDGVIVKGPRFRITRTGKPVGKGTRVAAASEAALREALRDLAVEAIALTGEWKLKVKVANGTLLSWDVQEAGPSTLPEIK